MAIDGRTKSYLKDKSKTTQRKCLRCGKKFPSLWVGNRICEKCTKINSTQYDFNI